MAATGKPDARRAAERVKRGIERYAAGDFSSAASEFEEAIRLAPGHPRARACLAWVRDVVSGRRHIQGRNGGLDEETVRAVAAALSDGVAPLPGKSATKAGRAIAPPSLPAQRPPGPADPARVDSYSSAELSVAELIAAAELERLSRSGPLLVPGGSPRASAPPPMPGMARPPSGSKLPSLSTPSLLTPAPAPPMLVPLPESVEEPTSELTRPRSDPKIVQLIAPPAGEEKAESETREWRPTPTPTNLHPIDVPELTEDQVAVLLHQAEQSLPGGSSTTLALIGEPAEPTEERRGVLLEIDASAPPPPRFINATTSADGQLPEPPGVTHEGERSEGGESEFNALELTPTRRHAAIPPRVDAAIEEDGYGGMSLPPLAPHLGEEAPAEESSTHGGATNPFIKGPGWARMVGFGHAPRVDDLPAAPNQSVRQATPLGLVPLERPGGAERREPGGPLATAAEAVERGDHARAFDACERAVEQAGGLAAEVLVPNHPLIERVYEAMVGSLGAVPQPGEPTGDLEPRSAFLLSRIDASMTVEDVLDVSGMPRLEALRCLAKLVRRGALVVK